MKSIFDNTFRFSHLTIKQLKKRRFLLSMMQRKRRLNFLLTLAIIGIKLRIPLIKYFIKQNIFNLFVGGEYLKELDNLVFNLNRQNILCTLDYGAEATKSEKYFLWNLSKFLETIFYAREQQIKFISIKLTALGSTEILEKISVKNYTLNSADELKLKNLITKLNTVCKIASDNKIKILIDAEESWIQNGIDMLCLRMMRLYNKKSALVFNTIQLYHKDKLRFFADQISLAKKEKIFYGAKIVRGAYLEKENNRAKKMGYPSPIHHTKMETDRDFNIAVRLGLDNIAVVSSIIATHNQKSIENSLELIHTLKISPQNAHVHFSQLLGMSDNLTYVLADHKYNVSKYIPYGQIQQLMPYLKRRINENSSIRQQSIEEYQNIKTEIALRLNK